MVDSGSDVVTLRQEVLDSLGLELIGPIKSKGVHASRTKNLYRANMVIGSHTLDIEVGTLNIGTSRSAVIILKLEQCGLTIE